METREQAAGMAPVLRVSGLCKSYEKFSLKDVSFCLPEGCVAGFIGVNGAGKTTTLRAVLGLAGEFSGDVEFFGLDMRTHQREIKDRIGVVLDDGCFYEGLTLAEMKSVVAPTYSSWSEKDFKDCLERFRLDPKQKIHTLSKGMKMKYALALALSHKAELLIMDEPTSGLDPLIRSQLLETLADFMAAGGKGVFFSTHITSDLDKIADMLVMIHRGRVLFQEDKDALLDRFRVAKGETRFLTEETRRLFMSLTETPYGFTGLTQRADEVRRQAPGAVFQRPTIEDIMLGYVKGEDA